MKTLIIDSEFESLIPPLTDEEFDALEKSIVAEGCRDAICTWQGTIVDGHNRYKICQKYGFPFNTIEKDFEDKNDALRWIIQNQFGRRNLNAYQRSVLALKLKPLIAQQAKERQGERNDLRKNLENKNNIVPTLEQCSEPNQGDGAILDSRQNLEPEPVPVAKTQMQNKTNSVLAERAGVGHSTIAKVARIEEVATPEIKKQLNNGDISINQAYKDIVNEEKKKQRAQDIERQIFEIEKGNIEKPTGLFDVIAIDPPWNYGTQYSATGRRVANPYPEMTQDELKALDIPAKDDSVMFLWTTNKFIWDAKELLDFWGFKYRAMLVWNKQKMGMGDLFRIQCEFCLVGIKGKPIFKENHGIRDIIEEQGREHSRKPEAFYAMVDALCGGDKLDYFSREHRDGWASYGNDTAKF